jgi:hypothetical protein
MLLPSANTDINRHGPALGSDAAPPAFVRRQHRRPICWRRHLAGTDLGGRRGGADKKIRIPALPLTRCHRAAWRARASCPLLQRCEPGHDLAVPRFGPNAAGGDRATASSSPAPARSYCLDVSRGSSAFPRLGVFAAVSHGAGAPGRAQPRCHRGALSGRTTSPIFAAWTSENLFASAGLLRGGQRRFDRVSSSSISCSGRCANSSGTPSSR